jgi:hypothetical protein
VKSNYVFGSEYGDKQHQWEMVNFHLIVLIIMHQCHHCIHHHLLRRIFSLCPDLNGEHLVFVVWLRLMAALILLHQNSHGLGDRFISGGRLLDIGGQQRQWCFFGFVSVAEDFIGTVNGLRDGDELEKYRKCWDYSN